MKKYLPMILASLVPSVALADVIFEQDFSSSGIVADYIGSGANQFDSLSEGASAGTWVITAGTLQVDRTGAGFGGSSVNSLDTNNMASTTLYSMSYSLSVDTALYNAASATSFFAGGGTLAANSNRALTEGYTANDASSYSFAGGTVTTNVAHTIYVYGNSSASSTTYDGPDGGTYALDGSNFAVWVDNVLYQDNIVSAAAFTSGVNSYNAFAYELRNPDNSVWVFDDFVVRDDLDIAVIPEPSFYAGILGSLALGVGSLMRRRRDKLVS